MAALETDETEARSEVAAFLREFADELEDGRVDAGSVARAEDGAGRSRRVTVNDGGAAVTVTVPESVEFDVAVNSRSPMLTDDVRQSISFELSWAIDDPEDHTDDLVVVE